MTDLDDISDGLRGVETAVREVKKAVEEHSVIREFAGLIWVVAIVWLVSLLGDAWHSKWRYSLQYSIEAKFVHVDKKPHDCDFLAAPLGEKFCHYERNLSKVWWARSYTTGQPITSIDDRKTWTEATPPTGSIVPVEPKMEYVDITWEKKDD